MMIKGFKIVLVLVGFITFLHAVIPHDHHSEKDEHSAHHHDHGNSSFLDFLELAFHNSQSYGASDTFTVDENFNQQVLISEEPLLLKWLREKELFVYYSTVYTEQVYSTQFIGFTKNLRGPPSLLA
jgi:hypothetical protein